MQNENLKQLLIEKRYRELRVAFSEMNEVDIARFIETLNREQATIAFRTLPKETEMDVFSELDADTQQHIIESITDKEIADIIEELWVDDAVDMLEEMPAVLVKRVLKNSSHETRKLINQFLKYPENSAGSIMTAEFTDLSPDITVADAISHIRLIGEDRETIYTCYVVDETRRLHGVITVKTLLLAHDNEMVRELMSGDIISVTTGTDQEETAKLMAKYNLISLPVVDAEKRLVGIVTVDDAVDVIQEEATEDFERMAAMAPSEKPYLKTSVLTLAKNRLSWLLILMVSGMVTGTILGHYESVYLAVPILVSFIPMLTGTGGNAGSQTSTLIIRGMVLDEIKMKDLPRVVLTECKVSLLVGTALALVNFIRMVVMQTSSVPVAFVVSAALIGSVFLAKTFGAVLPMLAKACKLDPALMAAPLITTIVDALVLILYFNVAKWVLI